MHLFCCRTRQFSPKISTLESKIRGRGGRDLTQFFHVFSKKREYSLVAPFSSESQPSPDGKMTKRLTSDKLFRPLQHQNRIYRMSTTIAFPRLKWSWFSRAPRSIEKIRPLGPRLKSLKLPIVREDQHSSSTKRPTRGKRRKGIPCLNRSYTRDPLQYFNATMSRRLGVDE